MLRYLTGDTDQLRQQQRDEIFSTTADDFRAFADVLQRLNQAGRVVVLGSGQAIDAANQARGGWLRMQKVL
jgi:Zn-dependent M16 (insulinase) family peptidase